ncbi:prepilin-type N-terminal cleavage/methylation domain-containing protein, partial [Patescibacteria group bacterium]|nr:prepilin-type N-terminal cleavage/methylation domain-containing protein [Patescibacteria group bacterium]
MKFFRGLRRTLADQRGYSLIELIGAMAMFALISVVIV